MADDIDDLLDEVESKYCGNGKACQEKKESQAKTSSQAKTLKPSNQISSTK